MIKIVGYIERFTPKMGITSKNLLVFEDQKFSKNLRLSV